MKYKLSILVVLYACHEDESKTLQSLNKCSVDERVKIIIWNNGPKEIITAGNYEVIQTIQNLPLSVIYNKFIESFDSERFVLFDHDSTIHQEYIDILLKACNEAIYLPVIYSNGEAIYPIYKDSFFSKKITINDDCELITPKMLMSIASGLSISATLVAKFKLLYGNVFDERFKFYGVDTSFFIRALKNNERFIINSSLNHSLSRLEKESEQRTLFRKKERLIDACLIFKNYYSFGTLLRLVMFFKNNKAYVLANVSIVLRCIFSGKHPGIK
ncbi:hypothetical protein RI837_13780 [Aeromonas caviae]|uniref:hypothetical protein n=1 Tax=Aeromonas caviae TaxID=648 RepID=UPI003443F17F